jgi:hypothetical protein
MTTSTLSHKRTGWQFFSYLARRAIILEIRGYQSIYRFLFRRPTVPPGAVGFSYHQPILAAEAGATGPVGIGIPGSVDPATGLAKGASSTWLNGKPVETDLRRALGRDVRIANDADCFAVSEAVDGSGAGHNVVFAVILGSGAGAGVAVGGKAHHGPNNSAG